MRTTITVRQRSQSTFAYCSRVAAATGSRLSPRGNGEGTGRRGPRMARAARLPPARRRRSLRHRSCRLRGACGRLAAPGRPRPRRVPARLRAALPHRSGRALVDALPHAADADRERRTARLRGRRARGARDGGALRGLDRRLGGGREDVRPACRDRDGGGAARVPGVRDHVPRGLERARVRGRVRGLGIPRRAGGTSGPRGGRSPSSGSASPSSPSRARGTPCSSRSSSSRSSCAAPGGRS